MWSRIFVYFTKTARQSYSQHRNFIGTRHRFYVTASLPPILLWFLPEWMTRQPLREEDVEPDPLRLVLRKAKLAEIRKQFQKSDELFHEGLKMLHDQYEKGEVNDDNFKLYRLHIINMMANSAFSKNDFESAENLFKHCVRGFVTELGYSPQHFAVIEVSLKLALIYASMNKRKEAEIGYRYCISTLEGNRLVKDGLGKQELTDEDRNALALYGMCLDGYCRFLVESSRYADAIGVARTAVLVSSRVFDENHPTWLSVLNSYGTALAGRGEFDEAGQVFKKCVGVAKRGLDDKTAMEGAGISIVDGDGVDSEIREQQLAQVLCACQCNVANTILQQSGGDVVEADVRKWCYSAKLIADRYKDEDCGREVGKIMARLKEKQTKSKKQRNI